MMRSMVLIILGSFTLLLVSCSILPCSKDLERQGNSSKAERATSMQEYHQKLIDKALTTWAAESNESVVRAMENLPIEQDWILLEGFDKDSGDLYYALLVEEETDFLFITNWMPAQSANKDLSGLDLEVDHEKSYVSKFHKKSLGKVMTKFKETLISSAESASTIGISLSGFSFGGSSDRLRTSKSPGGLFSFNLALPMDLEEFQELEMEQQAGYKAISMAFELLFEFRVLPSTH